MAALGSFSAMQSQLSRRAADDNAAHAGLSSGTREAHGSRGWPGAALVDDIDELFSGDAVLEARAEVESCGSLDSFGSGSPDFGGHACCCAAAGDSPSTDRRAAAREELPSACCEPGGSGLSARESVTKGQASGLSPSRKHRLEGPEPRGPRRSGEPPAAPLSSPVVTSASALAALAGGGGVRSTAVRLELPFEPAAHALPAAQSASHVGTARVSTGVLALRDGTAARVMASMVFTTMTDEKPRRLASSALESNVQFPRRARTERADPAAGATGEAVGTHKSGESAGGAKICVTLGEPWARAASGS